MDNNLIIKISECVELVSKGVPQNVKKGFRSKARDMPTNIFGRGLAYAITYAAARSSASAVELGLSAINCNSFISSIVKNEKLGDEDKGYALYGAMILYLLKEAKALNANSFKDALKTALDNPSVEVHANEIAEWIKRFAEAYIEE